MLYPASRMIKGDNLIPPVGLPSVYLENRLILMAQSPRVLYVYWELSPGQKIALAEKRRLKLRLNKVGSGTCRICDIDLNINKYYFNGVEPGILYNCDLCMIDNNGDLYPFISSKNVMAPQDKPVGDAGLSSVYIFNP